MEVHHRYKQPDRFPERADRDVYREKFTQRWKIGVLLGEPKLVGESRLQRSGSGRVSVVSGSRQQTLSCVPDFRWPQTIHSSRHPQ